MPRRPNLSPDQVDRVLFPAVSRFLNGEKPTDIARAMREEFGVPLNREGVYPLLREAVRRGHLLLCPPRHRVLSDLLSTLDNRGQANVLDVRGKGAATHVSAAAGDIVFELIQRVAHERGRGARVHLAFGIGRNTRRLVERLASLLSAQRTPPPLTIHAISPSAVGNPLDNPLSSFPQLHHAVADVEYVGFDYTPIVAAEHYESQIASAPVREAVEKRDEIDILVTGLAYSGDPHGYLYSYLERYAPDQIDALLQRDWVGDLQLCPYGVDGPIRIETGPRPMVLFELDDLVAMREAGKHVIVMVAPCGACMAMKTKALVPLLREPSLHVWSHLVLDADTAEEAIRMSASK